MSESAHPPFSEQMTRRREHDKRVSEAKRLHAQGKIKEAAAVYEQVLSADQTHPDALHHMGLALFQGNKAENAADLLMRAHGFEPGNVKILSDLSTALRSIGQAQAAEVYLRRALELDPDFVIGLTNLGGLYLDQRRLEDAVQVLERAVRLDGAGADAWGLLADAQSRRGEEAAAVAAFEKAVTLRPRDARLRNSYANVLYQMNRYDAAREQAGEALSLDPRFAEAQVTLANIAYAAGRFEEAEQDYRKAITLNPQNTNAWRSLAGCRKFAQGDPITQELERLEPQLAKAADPARMNFHFARGKVLMDQGADDRAMADFAAANALAAKRWSHDPDGTDRLYAKVMEIFSPENAARWSEAVRARLGEEADHFGSQMIFILGMPRSGTTLVEAALAAHPEVYGAGELVYLGNLGRRQISPSGRGFPVALPGLDPVVFQTIGEEYLRRVRDVVPAEAHFVTDKMPFNFEFLGLIPLALPGAKILHLTRDPRDVALSCWVQYFPAGLSWSYDLQHTARFLRSYQRLMDHWKAVFPGRILDVSYESMVEDFEGGARAVLDHCGLDWRDDILRFHEAKRPVRTASAEQVRRPVYAGSKGRWRRYAEHLGPIIAEFGSGDLPA